MKRKIEIKYKGFTLIELLVVVLIIGILSAIALPQYNKAVEKSKSAQALTMLRAAYQAAAVFYMENGTYPNSFADMGFEVPWTGTTQWTQTTNPNGGTKETKSNTDWSLQLYVTGDNALYLYMGRLSGKYAGGGFMTTVVDTDGKLNGKILCVERAEQGVVLDGDPGDYCIKIMNGTLDPTATGTFRSYVLP